MTTKPPKKPTTKSPTQTQAKHTQPLSIMDRCQNITKQIQVKIHEQIQTGQVIIRSNPVHIENDQHTKSVNQNPQKSIRDKISSLNMDLENLHKHIAQQKEQERIKQSVKKKQAAMLIERLKRQKQQHRNKLKYNEMSSRLKNSVISEDVIKLMRERRDNLIQEKKKDMQERIYKNLSRRAQRQEVQANNQISYWQKIKQIQDRKRHHSTKILPSIHRFNQQINPQFGVNMEGLQRKNSHININMNPYSNENKSNLLHKRRFSKQDLNSGLQYTEIVNKFLQRAKAKQVQSKSQKSPLMKSRILPYNNQKQTISQKNQSNLANSKATVLRNQKIQKIINSFNDNNRGKLLGNQYLKQSLLKVDRTKSPKSSSIIDNSLIEEPSLELKGNPAIFSRNNKLSYFQQRRQKIFQNLLTNKIQKSLAIQMLGPIESRLDKINPQGIQKRLKQKLQIFQELYRNDDTNTGRKLNRNLMMQGYEENQQVI